MRPRGASVTESGVQVDSSVAYQASRRHTVAGLVFPRSLLVVVRHPWSTFDGPATAQTAQNYLRGAWLPMRP